MFRQNGNATFIASFEARNRALSATSKTCVPSRAQPTIKSAKVSDRC